jgi:hypothetical protein
MHHTDILGKIDLRHARTGRIISESVWFLSIMMRVALPGPADDLLDLEITKDGIVESRAGDVSKTIAMVPCIYVAEGTSGQIRVAQIGVTEIAACKTYTPQ